MDDLELVEQYFLRDLTETEKRVLDEMLERSPGAAGLFQERAREVSLPRVLPELKLPPQPPPPRHGSVPISYWLWVLAGYGLLASAFWFWSRNHDIHWPWDQTEQGSLSGQAVSPAGWNQNLASPLADETGTDNDAALAMGAQPTPEDEADGMVTPVPVTASSPSNSGADNPGHSNLRLVVTRAMPALVTVTVLDPAGKEIRTLYDGALRAGRWAFKWDGFLADGSRAPIGAYTLQARSGSNVQKQEVWVDQ